jgi:hypothetical protein
VLDAYRPSSRYLLLDQGAIISDPSFPAEVRNLAAALFQLEHARDEATWLKVYQRLVELLDSQALGSLKRAFGRWIYRSFVRKKRPAVRLPDIDDYQEVHAVLEQRVEQWNRELIEKGRLEGESRLLLRMMARRFGPLPDWVEPQLGQATEAELHALADKVLDADSLDDLLANDSTGH